MKLYLQLITDEKGEIPTHPPVHGVDYRKGKDCGRAHEYMTRDCQPVVYTEEDIGRSLKEHPERYVELRYILEYDEKLKLEGVLGE